MPTAARPPIVEHIRGAETDTHSSCYCHGHDLTKYFSLTYRTRTEPVVHLPVILTMRAA
jgi:hypothetical protein